MVHLSVENQFVGNFTTRKQAEDRAYCFSDGVIYFVEYTNTRGDRVTYHKKVNSTSRRGCPTAHFVQGGSPGSKSGGR